MTNCRSVLLLRQSQPNLPRSIVVADEHPLQLIELPAGNFEVAAYKGLLIKGSYWRWPQRNLAGNAIDFFVQVLGLSFHDAMCQITRS